MRILVLGGTAWVGGEVARAAARFGADVTCVARGTAGAPPDGIRFRRADRTAPDAFDWARGERFDLVVDVTRQPGQARRAAQALAGMCRTYALISSVSVYAHPIEPGGDESAPVVAPLAGDVMSGLQDYAAAKVACEQHVLAAVGPDRALIVRAGLIGGPGDVSDRTGYWPLRAARPADPAGRVLVPDAAAQPTQVIDHRDLAAWVVRAGAAGVTGTFDAVGPTVPLGEHLTQAWQAARAAGATPGRPVLAGEEWLLSHDVTPWAGPQSLPLWTGGADAAAFCTRQGTAARAAGLTHRPLTETLLDTLRWELARDRAAARKAGLPAGVERDLIAELSA